MYMQCSFAQNVCFHYAFNYNADFHTVPFVAIYTVSNFSTLCD